MGDARRLQADRENFNSRVFWHQYRGLYTTSPGDVVDSSRTSLKKKKKIFKRISGRKKKQSAEDKTGNGLEVSVYRILQCGGGSDGAAWCI